MEKLIEDTIRAAVHKALNDVKAGQAFLEGDLEEEDFGSLLKGDDEKLQKLFVMVARRLGAILSPDRKKEGAKTVLQTLESQRELWMKEIREYGEVPVKQEEHEVPPTPPHQEESVEAPPLAGGSVETDAERESEDTQAQSTAHEMNVEMSVTRREAEIPPLMVTGTSAKENDNTMSSSSDRFPVARRADEMENDDGHPCRNNPSQQQQPRDQISFTFSSHDAPQRNFPPPHPQGPDSSHDKSRPSHQANRPWNKWARPRSPNENLARNVRSRTASLTDEEEQQVVEPSATRITSTSASVTAESTVSSPTAHIEPSASLHQEAEGSRTETKNVRAVQVASSTQSHQAATVSSSTESLADSVPDEPHGATNNQAPAAVASAALSANNSVVCPFFYHESEGDPMAFCCAKCRCPPERAERYGGAISTGAEGDYCHRHCCHNIAQEEVSKNWLPPLQNLQDAMQQKLVEAMEREEDYPAPEPKTEDSRFVANRARKNAASLVRNNDEIENPLDLLNTNKQYIENQKEFAKVVQKRQHDRRPAVVLDVFAGIGAALVVLKRLHIAMSKVVHVEHDEIANHVVRRNHDHQHNPSLSDDGIEHVYISTFQEMEGSIDQFLQEHGPIDIIVGGPPCQDYTGINANAQGPSGAQGQFLPRFASFIQDVQEQQRGHPVYYLIENVVFNNGNRVDNYKLIENLTGVVETRIEALYFSPCKRHRSYWTNFPLENSEHGYEQAVAIHPDSCLEEGWIYPVEDEVECVKVNTFLASRGRIKDSRMEKYKPVGDNKHEKAYFSSLERERMLGFPENYVKDAVEHLFTEVFDKALNLQFPNESKPDTLWKSQLDPKYWCFSGRPVRYEEAYNHIEQAPYVRILLSPPQVTQNLDFFNAEDYSLHLLGNSFSIPVVEYLMTRLCEVFASREYEGYNYQYRWENNNGD